MNEVLESLKGKTMANVSSVQVSLTFDHDTGIVVPLSATQAAFLLRMMGFQLSDYKLSYFSDDDINAIMEEIS